MDEIAKKAALYRAPAPAPKEVAPATGTVFAAAPPPPSRLLGTLDSATRKRYPMCTGLLDYFTDALAEVSLISHMGNEKHNPGQPLHWARGKSMDHADCVVRHLAERGSRDSEGVRHSAQLAWRALALLQQEIEDERGFPPSRGCR